MVTLTDIVAEGAIIASLKSSDRDAVITELVQALTACNAAPPAIRDELVAKVLERERRGSTGFGKGVAVPHVKHKSITKMTAAIGLSQRGVDFNALDRSPVFSVVLLVSPEDRPEEHLQAMEVIFKNLSKDTFRRFLRQATTVQDVKTLLEEADAQHLPG
ncbi:MAG: PTS sugar transporter subunit IIA [Planctomycetes bacterium]|nr:PTS sugar transporter subunit IIA [Planctomycetota bacterium]